MNTSSKNWHAWLNAMPPKPDSFHVVGDVEVANPGVKAILTMRAPQGINPGILMLDLHLIQEPGIWPQMMVCTQARYDRVMPPGSPNYSAVDVYQHGERIAYIDNIPVIT
ncbi:hypothetical protein KVG96_12285 [Pseudomonas sp. COR58]|uniref:Uncharacterized protein n=1 Tax=Pseudomonas ekonensis TaxID=2842353 RepID=A0ABS6PE25_9PSED|nr:hypothetical protein [Pseudomonas ekonensis]MBV4458731.1 hypothetical protein [Pseudomonas ekonensis]